MPGTPSKGSSISSSREDGLAKELGLVESRTESVGVGNDRFVPSLFFPCLSPALEGSSAATQHLEP